MRLDNIKGVLQVSETLVEEANRLLTFLSEFVDEKNKAFDLNETITGFDSSTAEVCSRIFCVTEIIGKFDKTTNAELVPLDLLNTLETSLDSTTKSIQEIVSYVSSHQKSDGGLKSMSYSNFHALMKNGQTINFQPHFAGLYNDVEELLSSFYRNLVILKPAKATYSFQAAANGLSSMLGRTEEEHDALRKQLSDLKKVTDQTQKFENTAKTAAEEVGRLKTESSNERKTISEYLATITERQAAVTNIHAEAVKLKSQVEDYQIDFEKFQNQLDERDGVFKSGTSSLATLNKEFEDQRLSIQELVNQSEGMLKSATVAGLAGHFEQIRSQLTEELQSARNAFYLGIVFLLISVIPLALLIFWPVVAPFLEIYNPVWATILKGYSPNIDQTGWQYLGTVLARFIILVPAAWFVSFSAIKHSSLFRLREHYTYKYSMAVSVEGFKKQAKMYEDEIAALVLEQLAFNPADKLTSSKEVYEGKSSNPIMRYLMARIEKRFEKLNNPTE